MSKTCRKSLLQAQEGRTPVEAEECSGEEARAHGGRESGAIWLGTIGDRDAMEKENNDAFYSRDIYNMH
ncbi:hypothetical protein U9M48_030686 [Paspalum notatum var. saurae]|uniref:Uncharacterized protein n=1 Tax=Paspalum notatum var. saurae TaxID=547442 RepID=A0AAQ3U0Y9_PASNO